jgi:hypothetical protein
MVRYLQWRPDCLSEPGRVKIGVRTYFLYKDWQLSLLNNIVNNLGFQKGIS